MSQQREISSVSPALSFYHLTSLPPDRVYFSRYGNTLLPPPDYKQSEVMLHALLICVPQHLSDKRYLTNSPIFMNPLKRHGFWTLWISLAIFRKRRPVIDCVSRFSSTGLGFHLCKVRGLDSVPPARVWPMRQQYWHHLEACWECRLSGLSPTYWIRICI